MKRLGISIYPEFSKEKENLEYIKKAYAHGFRILFIAFLALDGSREEVIERYVPLTKYAKDLGYEIICDVNPKVFKKFRVNASVFNGKIDLSFFKELKIDVLRLDTGLSELEEVFLSKNKFGIKLCINAASSNNHIASLIAAGAKKENIIGCHNYYPHRYTGINEDYYLKTTSYFKQEDVRCQVFINSNNACAFGPWEICEGLPTLEKHRNLPIDVQYQHLAMLGGCEDIIIGNCFATDEELEQLGKIANNVPTFHVKLEENVVEEQIKPLRISLSRRGERNDYLIRTIESRMFKSDVNPFNTVDIKRGDVLIDNILYGQYAGEVQIALKDMKNEGRTNVLGHINEEELFLLDLLKDNQEFCLKIINE